MTTNTHFTIAEATYCAMGVMPFETHALVTINTGDASAIELRLDGMQFEMLRNLLNDFANRGKANSVWSMDGVIERPAAVGAEVAA